jgi:RNA polymerase sigma-70 factor (ECF subfamily)
MAGTHSDQELAQRAAGGDRDALSELLYRHYAPIETLIRRGIPDDLREKLDAEDVLQDVHVEAFRTIAKLDPAGDDAFIRWLTTIAQQRLIDRIRAARRLKRGGGRVRIRTMAGAARDGLSGLLNRLAVDPHSPTRSLAGREAAEAVQVALAGLEEPYREAIRLRYIERLKIAEVAERLEKTEGAAQMLCHRGLRKLREALGRASRYLS